VSVTLSAKEPEPALRASHGYVSEADRQRYMSQAVFYTGTADWFPGVDDIKNYKAAEAPAPVTYCHYFLRVNLGTNPKFRCYLADKDRNYITTKGLVIPFDDVAQVTPTGELEDAKENVLGKAEEVRVKYYPTEWALEHISDYKPRHDRKNDTPEAKYKDRYTEVAAARVMWALGFPVDDLWPVREVHCFGCPSDPFYPNKSKKIYPELVFEDAVVERRIKGKKIESEPTLFGQGWDWGEARAALKGASRQQQIEFEGLLVILSLLNHISNDFEQQRIVCDKGSIGADGLCNRTIMMVQDLGSTFGHKSKEYKSKGSFKHWSKEPVFSDPGKCVLNLEFSTEHDSKDVKLTISQEGVDFIKSKLSRLPEESVHAIFELAKMDKADQELKKDLVKDLKKEHKDWDKDRIKEEASRLSLTMWTAAFMRKADEIRQASCK